MGLAAKLRLWVRPLRHTVLHPQWFALRDERRVQHWVGENARGRVLDIGCAGGWVAPA